MTWARDLGRWKVLIVDDDESARYIGRKLVESLPVEVFEAGSASEAVQLISLIRPDLVILDYVLPDATGSAVIESLRSSHATRRVPVLLYTAYEHLPEEKDKSNVVAVLAKERLDPGKARQAILSALQD
jgi:CheY-like chemotaxis protein